MATEVAGEEEQSEIAADRARPGRRCPHRGSRATTAQFRGRSGRQVSRQRGPRAPWSPHRRHPAPRPRRAAGAPPPRRAWGRRRSARTRPGNGSPLGRAPRCAAARRWRGSPPAALNTPLCVLSHASTARHRLQAIPRRGAPSLQGVAAATAGREAVQARQAPFSGRRRQSISYPPPPSAPSRPRPGPRASSASDRERDCVWRGDEATPARHTARASHRSAWRPPQRLEPPASRRAHPKEQQSSLSRPRHAAPAASGSTRTAAAARTPLPSLPPPTPPHPARGRRP